MNYGVFRGIISKAETNEKFFSFARPADFSSSAYNILMQKFIEEKPIVLHQGLFKPIATVPEAIFMITGMTIGAGILGLPYVVAQVGLKTGLAQIFVLGLVMLSLNLMIGEVAVRTNEPLQIPGLAGKYLGKWAKILLSAMMIFSGYGVLLAYLIGEGASLRAIFGGSEEVWAVLFWSIASFFVWRGLKAVKKAEKILSAAVIAIIVFISLFLLPKFNAVNWNHSNFSNFFIPFGVILFALSAIPSVIEAHALLPGSQRHFKKALIIGSLIPVAVYLIFTLAVVGVMGGSVTEVATIGLGDKFGGGLFLAGNIFAIMAMGSGFLGLGLVLKQIFVWDLKINKRAAEFFTIAVPLVLYLLGIRSFVAVLGIVGGLFVGAEAMAILAICWRAKKRGDLDASRYGLRYFWLLAIPIFLVFAWVFLSTIIKLLAG